MISENSSIPLPSLLYPLAHRTDRKFGVPLKKASETEMTTDKENDRKPQNVKE